MERGENCKLRIILFLMELPINHKDLDTIISALSLGGDARLYHLLKGLSSNEAFANDVAATLETSGVGISL